MIDIKKEWNELPNYLFLEVGDQVIRTVSNKEFRGVIKGKHGDRNVVIEKYLRKEFPIDIYFGYIVDLENGTTISDYCYVFKPDVSKLRENKINEILIK